MLSFEEFLNEGRKVSDYKIYHDTYSSAMREMEDFVAKNGYQVDPDDYHNKVAVGPKKPSEGKTNRFILDLQNKDGTPVKNRSVHFQVYGMGTTYELNMYVQ